MKTKPIVSAEIEIEVQFFDVDSMRVVWHGNYVKYLEQARCELLKKFNYNYIEMERSGHVWPIVDMRIKYVASAKLSEIIVIQASLVEYETRLKIDYVVKSKATGKTLTKAHTIQVAVEVSSGEMLYEAPQCLLARLSNYIEV